MESLKTNSMDSRAVHAELEKVIRDMHDLQTCIRHADMQLETCKREQADETSVGQFEYCFTTDISRRPGAT